MSEDNNKIGATITYDSQHALDAARKYKEQIAAQLGHKLASRPYTPAEQRRNAIGTKLLAATEGKTSLPQNIAAAYPSGSAPSTGTTTDSFLKKSGADYSGWHQNKPSQYEWCFR
jgi:regulator of protease activity HflC (stomatin/prohibitin superfamily)